MQIQKQKPGRKSNLSAQKIKRMIDNGMRQKDIATFFGVSQPTISRLTVPLKSSKKNKKNTRLCTCCNQRPIATGNRFLCLECFDGRNLKNRMSWG
ncbi:MAG: hypothetical protein GY710_25670 [Desulfobacteraceae bacterium]|nr:hypothetical protein [Desulfobacteraceae bacterium]